MPAYHSEPEWPGIWRARRASVLRPTVERDTGLGPLHRPSLLRSGGCAARSRSRWPLPSRWGCHRLCPGTGSAALPRGERAARQPPPAAFLRALLCRAGSQERRRRPTAPRPPLPAARAWCPLWHGRWGWGRLGPPQAGFEARCIRRLPLPVHTAEFRTLAYEGRPDPVEDTQTPPALKGPMDAAVIGKLAG